MTIPNKDEINAVLQQISFPDGSNMAERASHPVIKNNKIAFALDITGHDIHLGEKLRNMATRKIVSLFPNIHLNIVITSSKQSEQKQSESIKFVSAQPKNINRDTENKINAEIQNIKSKIHIDGASKVIVVTSGKGGVGKSTITSLLAHKLKQDGKKVGVLDADIYGPSIPRIFNINTKPELDYKKMVPLESFGIQLNSIGFITAAGASISWRGPMVSKALYQLISLTKWRDLDYLLIDMPPGTGDIHISLLENYVIDGVIFVTTPQAISEIDVTRSIDLYKKFDVEILGIIENMSYIIDPNTDKKIILFPGSGGQNIATKHKISMLDIIPLVPDLAEAIDNGRDLSDYTHFILNSCL